MKKEKLQIPIDDLELKDYIDRNVGISRKRLNIQAFIGFFIFGWLMKVNYDELNKKKIGSVFIVVILFLVGLSYLSRYDPELRGASVVFWSAAVVFYLAAWLHTNILLTSLQKVMKEKYFSLKRSEEIKYKMQVDNNWQKDQVEINVNQILSQQDLDLINKTNNPKIARFLAVTKYAWGNGDLDFYSDRFKNDATKVDLSTFIKSIDRNLYVLLHESDKIREFVEGAYLISYTNNVFLMTNQVIYFYPNKTILCRPDIINLSDIKSYSATTKFLSLTINIELKSGVTVTFNNFKNAPDKNMVKHYIKF